MGEAEAIRQFASRHLPKLIATRAKLAASHEELEAAARHAPSLVGALVHSRKILDSADREIERWERILRSAPSD